MSDDDDNHFRIQRRRHRRNKDDENVDNSKENGNDKSTKAFVKTTQSEMEEQSKYSLLNDLAGLLDNREVSDVTVVWKDKRKKEFVHKLHSNILSARSQWFNKNIAKDVTLNFDTIYDCLKVVKVVDNSGTLFVFNDCQKKSLVEHKTITEIEFQEFVKYLYTADIKLKSTNVQSILLLASAFEVKSLQDEVIRFINVELNTDKVDIDGLVLIIRLAYRDDNKGLKDVIKKNINIYKKAIKKYDIWEILENDSICKDKLGEIKFDLFTSSI